MPAELDSSRPELVPVQSVESLEAALTFLGALDLGTAQRMHLASVCGAAVCQPLVGAGAGVSGR